MNKCPICNGWITRKARGVCMKKKKEQQKGE